jgi:DNA (cytosine-5)-methyltransferase 1
MLRVISEVRPRWVIGENVANFDRMGLEKMVSDLEAIDYEVAPTFEIPACAVGHEHRRTRLWIICHANGDRKSECTVNADDDAGTHRRNNGVSSRMDRLRALGNAVVPQIPEIIGLAITTEQ